MKINTLIMTILLFSLKLEAGKLRSCKQVYTSKLNSLFIGAICTIFIAKEPAKGALAPPRLGVNEAGSFTELCPSNLFAGCVSSQDDRPSFFMAPWEYDGKFENIKGKLVRYVKQLSNTKLVFESDRYLRFEIDDENNRFTDDLEFFFPENDDIIQYRSCRRGNGGDLGENKVRIEKIRKALQLDNIAILRNRRRLFLFGESPFDSFGPPTTMFESSIDNLSGDMAPPK